MDCWEDFYDMRLATWKTESWGRAEPLAHVNVPAKKEVRVCPSLGSKPQDPSTTSGQLPAPSFEMQTRRQKE